jgi:hypothetical protein
MASRPEAVSTAGIVLGWIGVVGLIIISVAFAQTWSFIDGGPETWTRTVIGWNYLVPDDAADWFPDVVALRLRYRSYRAERS